MSNATAPTGIEKLVPGNFRRADPARKREAICLVASGNTDDPGYAEAVRLVVADTYGYCWYFAANKLGIDEHILEDVAHELVAGVYAALDTVQLQPGYDPLLSFRMAVYWQFRKITGRNTYYRKKAIRLEMVTQRTYKNIAVDRHNMFRELARKEENALLREQFQALLPLLTPRQQHVIRGYFGIGREPVLLRTLSEELGVSKQRTQTLKQEALHDLQRLMATRYPRTFLANQKECDTVSESDSTGLPPGWRYLATQERRPRHDNHVDYGSDAAVLVRRGTRRVLYQLGSKQRVRGRQYRQASICLERFDNGWPMDTDLVKGRLTPSTVTAVLYQLRDYLGTEELGVEHLDRNRTLVIPEANDA